MELKLKLVTTRPGGLWWVGGWTKTKLMLFSTQVEVVLEDGVELGNKQQTNNLETIFYTVCLMTQDSFAKR